MDRSQGDAVFPGSLVRDRRLARGLTQRELARRTGLSLGTVRDLEQGRTRRPHPGSLAKLSRALGLSTKQARELGAASAAGGLLLEVLGPLAAWRDGKQLPLAGGARRAVLALLALSPGTLVHRETIIDTLWPENPPASAVNLVQAHLSRLRRLLDPGPSAPGGCSLLASVGASYRLDAGPGQLDLLMLDRLIADATAACSRSDSEAACCLYQQALELWRGDPLSDVDLLRGHPAVVRLSRRRAEVVIAYARVASYAGRHDRVLSPLRELAAREPLNEQAHAQLMMALAGSGQQAESLAVYQDMRRRLDDELGMPPGSELAAAYQRVLCQDIAPARAGQAVGAARASAATAVSVANGARRAASGPMLPRQLPTAPKLFVGREAQLSALGELLDSATGAVVISAIGGTAGIGKTALAVHWAHQAAAEFADGQLYVDLRGFDPSAAPVAPQEALDWFLGAMGVTAAGIPASLDERAALFRSLVAGKRLLVVLDNARDADQVRPLLPGSARCLVLVTSRAQLQSLAAREGALLMILDVLTEAEARQMLTSRLGRARTATEPDAVNELIGLCARLPLALAIIAARAASRPVLALAELAAELRDSARKLDVLDAGDATSSLRAVTSWSYEQLTPKAARMFRLLGLHPGPDITVPAAASLAGVPIPAGRQTLAELTAASLLTERASGRLGFHDLLRAYAAEQAAARDSAADRQAALGRMLHHYLHTAHAAAVLQYPAREPIALHPAAAGVTPEQIEDADQALAWFEAEHQVLRAAALTAARDGIDSCSWQLAWAVAEFLDRQGQFDEQAKICQAAFDAAVRLGDVAGQAATLRTLAHNTARRGAYEQAKAHLKRCLELYRQLGDRPGEVRVHHTFSFIFGRQGRYAAAATHCKQALAICRATRHQHGEAAALNNLAWNVALLGDLQRARRICQQSLSLHRKLGSPMEGVSWDTLGYISSQAGRHAEAARCYERALAVFRRHGHRFYEADTLTHLGEAWDAVGRAQDARRAWQQALRILEDMHHPSAGELRTKLGARVAAPTA